MQSILLNADDDSCSHNADGWSVKEHAGHLYDLEELWWKRLQDFLDRKEILSFADITNIKTKEAGHNGKSLEQLMQQFTMERQRMLEAVYYFDKLTLALTSIHPRLQSMRLIDSLFFVAEHDDHHVTAISNLLRKPQEGFIE